MTPYVNAPIVIASRQTFTGVSAASVPVDISFWLPGSDFTLSLLIASSNGVPVLISIQDSMDDFVSDIQLVADYDLQGRVAAPTDVKVSWRGRDIGAFSHWTGFGEGQSAGHIAERSGERDAFL